MPLSRSILLLLCAAPLTTLGQVPDPRSGPKLGVGMASISGGSFLSWNGLPKFGPLGGWGFEAPLTQQASLLIEPMLMSKGSVSVNNVLKTRTSVSLLYIEMPLMLKLSLRPDPQGTYLSAGILYGYFVRGRVRNYLDGNEVSNYAFASAQGNSQWSFGLGLGREMKNWLVEVRGQNSFRLFTSYITAHNIVISLQVTWRLPLRKQKKKDEDEEDIEE